MPSLRVMNATAFLRNELQKQLTEIQSKNSRFSIRAFAKQIGLQSGTLSLILLGKRTISFRLASKIIQSLSLDPSVREQLLSSLKTDKVKKQTADLRLLQLQSDQFQILKDWRHFAILSLMNTKGFKSDHRWMARRLGVDADSCKLAWRRLQKLKLVEKTPSGTWKARYDRIRTNEDDLVPALRYSHFEALDLAKEALGREPLSRREFNWLVVAILKDDIPIIKKRIRMFREQIVQDFGRRSGADEVFRINLQFFPCTKGTSEGGK